MVLLTSSVGIRPIIRRPVCAFFSWVMFVPTSLTFFSLPSRELIKCVEGLLLGTLSTRGLTNNAVLDIFVLEMTFPSVEPKVYPFFAVDDESLTSGVSGSQDPILSKCSTSSSPHGCK